MASWRASGPRNTPASWRGSSPFPPRTAAQTRRVVRSPTLAARCAAGAIHDLTPEFVADFNARYDLAHYWDPAPAIEHVVSLAAAPVIGNLSDGLVTKDSALALPYAQKLVWTPATRVFSLHQAVMHAPQVYRDLRTWSQFDQPMRDTR